MRPTPKRLGMTSTMQNGHGTHWPWVLMFVFALAIGVRALMLEDGREHTATFFGLETVDIAHFFGGGLALISGSLAIKPGLALRRPRLHRISGRMYVVSVLASGIAGLLMSFGAFGGWVSTLGFGGLAVLWVTTTMIGLRMALIRRFVPHRRWMIRSYSLALSAVTLRIYLPLSMVMFEDFTNAYRVIAWFCWVPNLIAAELWLARSPARRTSLAAA